MTKKSNDTAREQARASFRDEADEAWRDYQRTGLHVTQAEIDAWAKSLGSRRPRPVPKAHVSKVSGRGQR